MRSFLIATFILAACPAYASDREAVPLATPVGKAVSCIQLNQVQETRVHGDKVIDFVTYGNRVYRNVLPDACPSLGFEERFEHKTSTNDYCSVDTITVLQSPGLMHGATCGLGEFQEVKLVNPKGDQ